MKAEEAITKREDIHRMLLNMELAPISTSIAAYKTAIKEITTYIDELEGKQVPKKGKWIDSWRSKMDGTRYWYRECDHCGYERNDCDSEKDSNFCPNCGAYMRDD